MATAEPNRPIALGSGTIVGPSSIRYASMISAVIGRSNTTPSHQLRSSNGPPGGNGSRRSGGKFANEPKLGPSPTATSGSQRTCTFSQVGQTEPVSIGKGADLGNLMIWRPDGKKCLSFCSLFLCSFLFLRNAVQRQPTKSQSRCVWFGEVTQPGGVFCTCIVPLRSAHLPNIPPGVASACPV